MAQMMDGVTCMAFTVSFVPNTGNKYFLAAADENLRLYDFEKETVSAFVAGEQNYSSTSFLLIRLLYISSQLLVTSNLREYVLVLLRLW
jgi:IS1 family transposase